jgi:hypothetical protein
MSAPKQWRFWSDEEIELLRREAAKGLPVKTIALRFPRHTPHAVRDKLVKLGGVILLRVRK